MSTGSSPPTTPVASAPPSLKTLALVFLRLGTTAFGGPAAHIAMMEEEFVQRHGWVSREDFLDLIGASNLIPGPSSTEVAIHLGLRLAGWRGLVLAGTCFILPAMLLVLAIAWAYVRYHTLPAFSGILYGIKPVIIAVIVQAMIRLSKAAMKSRLLWALAGVIAALDYLGIDILALLLLAGAAAALARCLTQLRVRRASRRSDPPPVGRGFTPVISPLLPLFRPKAALAAGSSLAAVALWPLFLQFVKIGAVLYGSGYVLLAFLRADLEVHLHWLTERQILDAVAVGQATPGPVFTTATFIGYILAGPAGALVATVAIFLPAFVFVGLSGRVVPLIRRSPVAGAFLDGVNAAGLALMAVVGWDLARAAVVDFATVLIAVGSALLLLARKWSSTWVLLCGAVVGLAVSLLH